jgi:putative transposase
LIKIYLGRVSVRGVEGITEAAVGHAGVAVGGEAWRQRPIEGEHPYVYLDGIVLKHSWADEVRLIAVQEHSHLIR